MKIHFTLVMALANIAFAVAGTSAGHMSIKTFMEQNIDLPVNGSARIIDGRPVPIRKVPYMCSLRKMRDHYCGCSILSNYFILTAAHCVSRYRGEHTKYYAYVGTSSRTRGGSLHIVKTIKIYPRYSWPRDDIAVLELINPINMSLPNRKAVILPKPSQELPPWQTVAVSGWGATREKGQFPGNGLRRVFLKHIARGLCRQLWNNKFITTNMICTKRKNKGPCRRDGGGPLMAKYGGATMQYGIVSFVSARCTKAPAVYTRVSAYIQWINSVTVRSG